MRVLLKAGVLLCAVMVTPSDFGLAQTPAPTGPPPTSQAPPSQPPTAVGATASQSQDLLQLKVDLAELKKELADQRLAMLKEQLKDLDGKLAYFVTVFAAIIGALAVFGAIPVIAAIRSSIAADRRAAEVHSLAIGGEKANQGRAAEVHGTFLEGSKQTLDLVNATLTLAKEASERAATIIQRRAKAALEDLHHEAKRMLAEFANQGDRALVADTQQRSNLISLATKIDRFETNSFMFPEELPLTPECKFIRGHDFHLKQQFEDAFNQWHAVALGAQAPDDLRSLAWYWIGYERNNLEKFDVAEEAFQNAEKLESGPRRYELRRIRLETRFFNRTRAASDAIEPLTGLLHAIEEADVGGSLGSIRGDILTTLGNVLYQAGREAHSEVDRKERFTKAEAVYRQAGEKQWARFGLGQVCYELGKREEGEKILASEAKKNAQNEAIRRVEHRTKVLARSTELICCVLVDRLHDEARAVFGDLVGALGMVDNRMTVYSQFQKRNVGKEEFRRDLGAFLSKHGMAEFRI